MKYDSINTARLNNLEHQVSEMHTLFQEWINSNSLPPKPPTQRNYPSQEHWGYRAFPFQNEMHSQDSFNCTQPPWPNNTIPQEQVPYSNNNSHLLTKQHLPNDEPFLKALLNNRVEKEEIKDWIYLVFFPTLSEEEREDKVIDTLLKQTLSYSVFVKNTSTDKKDVTKNLSPAAIAVINFLVEDKPLDEIGLVFLIKGLSSLLDVSENYLCHLFDIDKY